jgi:phosphonate transport system substrate-binding protein
MSFEKNRSLRAFITLVTTLVFAGPAAAQSWKEKYKELTFAVVPAENADGVLQRYEPMMAYMSRTLGVPVKLRVANDYAAVIEGLRNGQVHYAHLGPSAYARAHLVTSGGVEPLVSLIDMTGTIGYFSVLYVRSDDPAQKLQDLKGRTLCLVDPNSASGNNVPRFALHKMGITPETFFSKVVYSGSHENAVIALQQKTCDGAFNWWNSPEASNLLRMAKKGMVRAEDFRIVFKSDLIPGSPITVMASQPEPLKADLRKALLDVATADKAAFDRLTDGKYLRYGEVNKDFYGVVIELTQFVDGLRKSSR